MIIRKRVERRLDKMKKIKEILNEIEAMLKDEVQRKDLLEPAGDLGMSKLSAKVFMKQNDLTEKESILLEAILRCIELDGDCDFAKEVLNMDSLGDMLEIVIIRFMGTQPEIEELFDAYILG